MCTCDFVLLPLGRRVKEKLFADGYDFFENYNSETFVCNTS